MSTYDNNVNISPHSAGFLFPDRLVMLTLLYGKNRVLLTLLDTRIDK